MKDIIIPICGVFLIVIIFVFQIFFLIYVLRQKDALRQLFNKPKEVQAAVNDTETLNIILPTLDCLQFEERLLCLDKIFGGQPLKHIIIQHGSRLSISGTTIYELSDSEISEKQSDIIFSSGMVG